MSKFIAVDVGAESGRLMVGTLDKGVLTLEEAYRFSNSSVTVHGSLYWNILDIFDEIKHGLRKISQNYGTDFVSLGIDTWALDFGLFAQDGHLLGNPHAYRDPRAQGMMEEVFKRVPKEEIFQATAGIQFLSINTLYHLMAMAQQQRPLLDLADCFLMIPDILNFWLTGRKAVEYTNATTTQFFDSRSCQWAADMLDKLGIPHHFLPEIILPGKKIGSLLPAVADEVGFAGLDVIAVASHDTASAIAGVPAQADDFAWLSSGTWSLMGGVAGKAITTPEAFEYNFSSYGGASGSVLPWKNIMGLWLVQECRRIWAKHGEELSYDELTRLAAQAKPFLAVANPDYSAFLSPDDMPAAIQDYCRSTGQAVPQSKGEIVRTALEGLALRYRWVMEKLEKLVGHSYPQLNIVGGGSQNMLLNQFTADAIGKPVIAGPVEATAMGNIMVQAVATGRLASLDAAREIIRSSTQTQTFAPTPNIEWDKAYQKFNDFLAQGK